MNKAPINFPLPKDWEPITDESAVLDFGRSINHEVASNVIDELKREVSSSHPLFGIECHPIAWNTMTRRNFLFATSDETMPYVSVHFTWHKEERAEYPAFSSFSNFNGFIE